MKEVSAPIDWGMIPKALSHYGALGYRYIETPWIVADSVARMTFDAEGLSCQRGTLVGSAEQGFLALDIDPEAKLISVSPCFRNEPVIDVLHQTFFMKVELYWGGSHEMECLSDAMSFFQQHLDCNIEITSQGHDIVSRGIEIGSYGTRNVNGRVWTYGTALALPRLSIAQGRFLFEK